MDPGTRTLWIGIDDGHGIGAFDHEPTQTGADAPVQDRPDCAIG